MPASPPMPPLPSTSGPVPDWIKLGASLLIVGMVTEALATVSKSAAYGFAFLVILAYLAAGDNMKAITDFFNRIGATSAGA